MTTRIHELAKELGLSSKDLVERLAKLKFKVKGPMSVVDEDLLAKIRRAMATVRPPSSKKSVLSAKPVSAKAKTKVEKKPVVAKPSVAAKAKEVAKKPLPAPKAPKLLKKAAVDKPKAEAVIVETSEARAPVTVVAEPAPKEAEPEVVLEEKKAEEVKALRQLQSSFPITVKDLATKIEIKPNELIRHLIGKRIFAALTHLLDQETAMQVAKDFGFELAPMPTLEERIDTEIAPDPLKLKPRAPVVTFMGHVDHGKTSLLDAIRQSKVAEGEAGGITQHIGAYEVYLEKGRVTFLDTPGHEAFTALRARGANATDVVVLVVAADDGVMPQTLEAMDHAKAAGVPIVVAINKIDRPDANPQKVKQQLAEYDLLAEDWGGKTIMVGVSAKTRQGIDNLLEMLLLEAEMLELKADPTKPAQGVVVEARLSKDRGPIATLLVQQGTLRLGDMVVVGSLSGRVRAMINDRGQRVKETIPASPVEILGLPSVPQAGDRFIVTADEKTAKQIVETRKERVSEAAQAHPKRITLDDLHQRIASGTLKELKLILKVDVQGSIEAIIQSLSKLISAEVKLNIIHKGVGEISESDVMLAAASDAVIIGFHVGVDPKVQVEAIKEGVDIRIFQIIYELVNAIKAAIEGLLTPKIEETFLGRAEVKRIFQISKVGSVAGSYVTKGSIRRDALIRVFRGKERLAETKISNLKRVKDDVREVQEGFECGISLESSVSLEPGDLIEAWEQRKVARTL